MNAKNKQSSPSKQVMDKEAEELKARFEGVNRAKFARDHGVPGKGAMIYQHINGLKPISMDAAIAYAKGFEVPLSDISMRLAAEAEKTAKHVGESNVRAVYDEDDNGELKKINTVTIKVRGGQHGFVIDEVIEVLKPIYFRDDWFQSNGYKPEKLIALIVKGSSMEPRYFDGDMIVINTADTEPVDNGAFVVNYEGEAILKRLVRDGGKWWLSSDNPDKVQFPTKECTSDICIIVGRVIHRQSETT